MSTINGSRLKILAMLFLFVPQESWDLQLWMFGYITCGFPRIFGYVLQVIKYSVSVPLDRGGFGGWNLMLTVVNIEDFDQKSGGKYPFFESYQESASPNGAKSIRKNILFCVFKFAAFYFIRNGSTLRVLRDRKLKKILRGRHQWRHERHWLF